MLSFKVMAGTSARDIPTVREGTALIGTRGIDFALRPSQKDAGVIPLHDQAQVLPIGRQAGVPINECPLFHTEESSQPRDILIREKHMSGPAAALAATMAGKGIPRRPTAGCL